MDSEGKETADETDEFLMSYACFYFCLLLISKDKKN